MGDAAPSRPIWQGAHAGSAPRSRAERIPGNRSPGSAGASNSKSASIVFAQSKSKCKFCGHHSVIVLETDPLSRTEGRKRRKSCEKCKKRFTDVEIPYSEYKRFTDAVETLAKMRKLLSVEEEEPVKEKPIKCTSCNFALPGRCAHDMPEYGTVDADDCNYYIQVQKQ